LKTFESILPMLQKKEPKKSYTTDEFEGLNYKLTNFLLLVRKIASKQPQVLKQSGLFETNPNNSRARSLTVAAPVFTISDSEAIEGNVAYQQK
jgi:hypothetical protein